MAGEDPTPAKLLDREIKPREDAGSEETEGEKSPETIQRAMRKMKERSPEGFSEITAMMGMMGHPLHQKMNDGHITQMLNLATQHDTNEHDLRKTQQANECTQGNWDRIAHLIYFAVFVGLVVFIISMFRTQPAVLVPILSGVGGAVTGFLGGIGYAKTKMSAKTDK